MAVPAPRSQDPLDSDQLALLYQEAPRTFVAQIETLPGPTPAFGIQPAAVAVVDLDGDDDLDIVCANRTRDDLTVFRQDGARTFTALALPSATPLPAGSEPVAVVAADLDGNGYPDVACANRGTDRLALFFQNVPGSFAQSQVLLPAGSSGPNDLVAADLDGDGDLDLVTANRASGSVTVIRQHAAGMFAPLAPLSAGAATSSVAATDLDGDGDLDLATADRDSDALSVFFQDEPLQFVRRLVLPVPANTSGPVSVAAADIDGDGDADLVCANQNDAPVVAVFFGRTK